MTISHWIFLRMRKVSNKICRENKTRILCSVTVFENHYVYQIMSKSVVEPERPQTRIRRMHVACWINKVTCAQAHASARSHSDIYNLITFSWQQWFRKPASMLHYMYVTSLVITGMELFTVSTNWITTHNSGHWHVTADAQVRSQINPCKFCDGHGCTVFIQILWFSLSVSFHKCSSLT
jgi:hypothetical protein